MSFINDRLDWPEIDEEGWLAHLDEVNRERFHLMINQNTHWIPVTGGLVKLVNMEPTHIFNLMNWLERNFELYKERYINESTKYVRNDKVSDTPLYQKVVQLHYEFMGNFGVVT